MKESINTVPLQLIEDTRKRIFDYAEKLSQGITPDTNLKVLETQTCAILSMRYRKHMPVGVARRLAKTKVRELFQATMDEISSKQ